MKKLFFVLACLLFAGIASAQKDSLSFDEHNKYIYYHVVEEPGLSLDTLQVRALYFLKMAYPKNKVKKAEASGNFTGTGKFLVLSGLTIAKNIDGEINYTYFIECKEQKYRYWLTDFVFTPYKIDRYGNSLPQKGVEIPLENGGFKLDKRTFESYLNQAGVYSKQFGDKLKQYMIRISATVPKTEQKKVISTKDW